MTGVAPPATAIICRATPATACPISLIRRGSTARAASPGEPNPYKRYRIEPLEPGDIRDVIEFILVTGHKPGDKVAAARGAKIFAAKGQCFDCHSADAQGDAAIGAPNLIDDVWLYGNGSREDIYDTISRGRAGICPPWDQVLSPVMVRALAVLVYMASHKEAPKTADRSPGPDAGTGG
jgi:cbb3-type cytochrome c oxidase subunit III